MLKPDDRVVVYMRPGCHVCARVKKFLTEHDVPYEARDVDSDPLTPRELWDLFNRKANRLRVPFTALNDGEDVVLGFDPQRLEGVFVHGELGGVQVASAVTAPVVYDDYTSAELDAALWTAPAPRDGAPGAHEVKTGQGQLQITGIEADVRFVSTQRFGTPPGTLVNFALDMSFEAEGGSPAPAVGPPMAQISLRDLPSGVLFGFDVTDDVILAVHLRAGVEGVATATEHFNHRVVTNQVTTAGQSHRYRITYEHDTSEARWYVDERCVYSATSPLQVEGASLSMGVRAGEGRCAVTWTPWEIAGG